MFIKILTKISLFIFLLFLTALSSSDILAQTATFNVNPFLYPSTRRIGYDVNKNQTSVLIITLYVDGRRVDVNECGSGTRCQSADTTARALDLPPSTIDLTAFVRICTRSSGVQIQNDTCDGKTIIAEDVVYLGTTGTAKLDAPVSPITQTDMRTLPALTISGLTPGWQYTIKLPGWKGDDLAHNQLPDCSIFTQKSQCPRYQWLADPSGILTARNICNNGQADRVSDPCTEIFGPGVYGLSIFQLNGIQAAYQQFCVVTCSYGLDHSGPFGSNPCSAGTTGSCPTAIGNISTNPTAFVGKILTIAISLAGGIALIIMVIGSVKLLMSANDPQKVANGRDMIIAAIAGLLFLIFSVLILRYLGSNLFGFFAVT